MSAPLEAISHEFKHQDPREMTSLLLAVAKSLNPKKVKSGVKLSLPF